LDIFNDSSEITQWILRRNGWKDFQDLEDFLSSKSTILDAGCGNGRITALFSKLAPESAITGYDINPDVAKENLVECKNVQIEKHDLMDASNRKFDFIYSQEVLHHVEKPKTAFQNLVNCLNPDGVIAIYVYKKKSVIREFTDEYIREKLSQMDYSEAIEMMSEISNFGKVLSELEIEIEVEKVDLIGIPAGKYSMQRLMYHFFFKCFYNEGLTASENNAINYDWYGPQIATKHTLAEIVGWYRDCNLTVTHNYEDEYGITVHGRNN
jgi:SAM-dependent methyltransferase